MLDFLRRYGPFSDLPQEDLGLVAPIFTSIEVAPGTALFRQDQPADRLYLVISGRVALRYKPYDGPELGLTRIGAGGAVGWSAVMGNPAYTATAIAGLPSELLAARASDLHALVIEHPEPGGRILDRLALAVSPRWAGAQQQVVGLLARSAAARTR
jgi:CRP/FNR family cyclic AMP-dependent transcriptional regulator